METQFTHNEPVGAFDRKSAAAYLSISIRQLDKLLTARAIQRLKIGRKTLIRVADLDDYLEGLAKEEFQCP